MVNGRYLYSAFLARVSAQSALQLKSPIYIHTYRCIHTLAEQAHSFISTQAPMAEPLGASGVQYIIQGHFDM